MAYPYAPTGKGARSRPALWLGLGLAFPLALLVAGRWGWTDPAVQAASLALRPLQQGISSLVQPLAGFFSSLQRANDLSRENGILRDQVGRLTSEVIRLREMEIENARLREQLNFVGSQSLGPLLPAAIIARDPSNLVKTVLINRGSDHGVRSGAVVLASGSLVGKVLQTYPASAKVVLITDPSFSVNGMIQRPDSRATGIATGEGSDGLLLRYLPQEEEIHNDDVVVTSGLGGNFPKGLVIGAVSQVRRSDMALFQEASVRPAAPLARLEEVLVLLDFVPTSASPR